MITPSEVTISIAFVIISPISSSPPALTVATFFISEPLTLMLFLAKTSKANLRAISMPFFISIGLAPAAIFFNPSCTIFCASMVAVVVPSPAFSLVLEATSSINFAPRFAKGFSILISLATAEPSFTISGEPNCFCITTFFAFGPIVTFTAFATIFTPFSSDSRDSSEKLNCFAILFGSCIHLLMSHRKVN